MKLPVTLLLAAVALCLGCYETKYKLVSPDAAKVDRSFIGDYEAFNGVATVVVTDDGKPSKATSEPTKDKTHLLVRNFDGKQYYVEMTEIPEKGVSDNPPSRMVAFTVELKGVTFVHLREITADGDLPEKHLILRIALSPDKNTLTFRNLSEDFFKKQTIDTDEQLRAVVEAHVNDDAMYDQGTVTMTRVASKK